MVIKNFVYKSKDYYALVKSIKHYKDADNYNDGDKKVMISWAQIMKVVVINMLMSK